MAGFSGLWAIDFAYNITLENSERLPMEVSVELLDTESTLYIIPARLPYGLYTRKGELLVCESHNGGVSIKGFRFTGEDWIIDESGGGIHLKDYGHLVTIESPEKWGNCAVWSADSKSSWDEPGEVTYNSYIGDNWVKVNSESYVRFSDFMRKYHPIPDYA